MPPSTVRPLRTEQLWQMRPLLVCSSLLLFAALAARAQGENGNENENDDEGFFVKLVRAFKNINPYVSKKHTHTQREMHRQ